MSMSHTVKRQRIEERNRCLALVEALRERLEDGLDKNRSNPKFINNAQYYPAFRTVERIIDLIKDLERDILNPAKSKGADFSMEELALAEEIIAEQNQNQFEVEP